MKYSELDAYLELTRWENERDDYRIKVYRNGYTVAEVGLWEQYNIRILDPTQMTEGLYRRLTELAKTPLTEREEEKQYWLRFTTPTLLKNFIPDGYLNIHRESNELSLSSDRKDTEYFKTIFTESEISQMDITGFEKIEVAP